MNLQLPPGGLLLGLGTDLVDIARIRGVHERQGDAFLNRVYTAEERAYCLSHRDPYPSLAARFAAKEAVAKAFTTGIGAELGWHSISVHLGTRSHPLVQLDAQGEALLRHVSATSILLSLTHTETLAMAVAALVRAP
jgi:holo-[acyl-carrier protein] synthase